MVSETFLRMTEITKDFPGVRALDRANLEINRGEIHGLVGENGAGKSTIIKSLAGVYQHDSGHISVDGASIDQLTPGIADELGIRFVHQELNLVPHFTIAESVFMGQELSTATGLDFAAMRRRAAETLKDSLGVDLNPKSLIRDLSPAERKLVQIARALVREGAKLIVFDEPTAPLAAAEVEKVLGAVRRLRERGISVLYVSHYLGEITELCDRVTVFRNGSDVGVVDPVTSESARELIRLMVGRDLEQLFPERSVEPGDEQLALDGLGDQQKFGDISFAVRSGEVVGLAGVLGSGCEEIVDSIVGLRPTKDGAVVVRGKKRRISSPAAALKHGIVLIPRDRRSDGLVLNLPVRDNITMSTLSEVATAGIISPRAVDERARTMVEQLDIRPADTARKARFLSGGNQQKTVLGRSLVAQAHVFILDEPTVGVDIGAKTEIYRLVSDLAADGRAVLVSSNDPAEILGLCDRVLVVVRGRIVSEHRAAELTRDELIERMTGSVMEGVSGV